MMTRVLSIILLLLVVQLSHAATRTISSAGGNYNATSTWVENAVPTAADDVVATSSSGQLTVNVASAAKTLNLTGYTDTLTMNANLSISGAVTLASGMTYTGSSNLICLTTATLTSNGVNISGGLQFNGTSQTFTLGDNWTVTGLVTCGGVTATTINGNTLTCNGGFTQTNVATVLGTTNFVLAGGTWTSTITSNVLRNNVSLAGNVTLATNVAYNTGILTYTSGTITTTGSTLTCAAATTFNTTGMNWNNITLSGTSQTHTLQSNLDLNGTLTLSGTTATTFSGAYNITTGNLTFSTAETVTIPSGLTATGQTTVSGATALNGSFTLYTGGITMNAALTGTFTGVVFNSRGTWSGTTAITKNVTINTTDTITIGTNAAYNTGTLTYTSGTVITTGSTLTCAAGTTFNCQGIAWNNVVFGGTSQTYTLQDHLDINGVFTCNGATSTIINGAYNLKLGGGYTQTTVPLVSGTSTFLFDGIGTWTGGSTLALRNNVNINTADSLIIGTNIAYNTGTITHTAGLVKTAGSTLTCTAGTTFNCPGIAWNNVTFGGASQTFTLSNDLDVNGVFTCNGTTATTINGAYNLKLGGGFTSSVLVSGTTPFLFDGKGTWSGGTLRNNLTINLSDTLTIGTNIGYNTGTFTYTAGVIKTTGSTLTLGATTNLSTGIDLITWNNVSLSGTSTYTMGSGLDMLGTLTFLGAATFSGAYTIGCGNLTISSTNNTQTITGDITVLGTTSLPVYLNIVNGSFTIYTTSLIAGSTGYSVLQGTIAISFTGGGTWSGTGPISVPITFAGNTTITGTVGCYSLTYSSGTITTTGSTVVSYGTATLDVPGIVWENFSFYNSTATLLSDIDVNGTLQFMGLHGGGAYPIQINGYTIYCWSLDFSRYPSITSSFIDGTTKIVMDGTGTLKGDNPGNATGLRLDLTFNTSGTITATGNLNYGKGTITYTSGTMNMTGSTLVTINTTQATLNTSGMTWGNIYWTIPTILASDCNISGTATNIIGSAFNGLYTYKCSGSLINANYSYLPVIGTSKWLMNGTGTLSTNSTSIFSSDITINTSGTITFGSTFNLTNANFTYTAGTIVSAGSTFQTLTTPSTININGSGFSMGKYVSSVSQSFGGTNGFTIDTFICTTAGRTFTFAAGKTYQIAKAITVVGTAASRCAFVSSSSGIDANLKLATGVIEDISFCNATDINSSAGQPVWTYKGTLTRQTNWKQISTEPRTVSYTF